MQKMQKFVLLLAVLLAPWAARAQDMSDYIFSTGTDATKWVAMDSATTILTPIASGSDSKASAVENIGFTFPFGGSTYTQFSVNTDGNLRLGGTVTGIANYATPFSSGNANTNNPKINILGCDGYGVSGSHYVKSLLVEDTMCVVEFCMGTYDNATRNFLYKWQIHLFASGNIEIVFPSADQMPSQNPAVARQSGLCISNTSGWFIDGNSNTASYFTNGTTATNAVNTWFGADRYFFFERSIRSCVKPTAVSAINLTADGATITWTPAGSATEWMVIVNGEDTYNSNTNSLTLTGLESNTPYTVGVRSICGVGDTSLAMFGSFRTACSTVQLPFFENFDSYTGTTLSTVDAHILPFCWDYINPGTTYPGYPLIYNNATYANSGSNSLRFYTYYSGTAYTNQTAILPMMDNSAIAGAQITMMMRTSSASYTNSSSIQVGLINDAGDDSSFVVLHTLNGFTVNNEEFTVVLSGAANYPWLNRIALRATKPTTSYNSVTIDDILIEPLPTCFRPSALTATQILSDSIVLSWVEDSISAGADYIVEYDTTGFTLGEGMQIFVSGDNTAIIDGLSGNTIYDIYVRAICGGTDTSSTRMISVHTACSPVQASELPYVYGFEDATATGAAGLISHCWHKGTNYSTAYPYPNATAHSGSKSLYFYSSSSSSYYSYAVLPLFETPVDNLMVSFWMRQGSTGAAYEGSLRVGVMTDPTDISTFTQLAVCNADGQTWTPQEVMLTDYTGSGRYIAFVDNCVNANTCYVYLDDVTVKLAPSCSRVQHLEATHVTTSNALIEWDANVVGEYAGGVLSYKNTTETDWTEISVSQDDFSYLLTSLTPSADYTVRFMTNCESGDTSEYAVVEFSTPALQCEGLVLIGDETPATTSYSVFINNLYNYTVSENLILASELNEMPDTIRSLQFYHAYSTPMTAKTNCIIYLGDTTLTSLSGFTDTTSLTRVYTGSMNCSEGWNTFTVQHPYYYNGGNLIVLVIDNSGDYDNSSHVWGVHTATGMTFNAYHDTYSYPNVSSMTTSSSSLRPNMKLQFGDCENPQTCLPADLWLTLLRSDSVGLSWIPGYEETSWIVRYREVGTENWTDLGSVSEMNYVVENLTPATTYEFALVSFCDNGDSAVATLTATTPCTALPTPFTENFASWTTGNSSAFTPACWTRNTTYNTTSYYPYVQSLSSDGDGKSMYMYNPSSSYRTWLALPMLEGQIQNMLMSFDMYSNYTTSGNSYAVRVGVMTDPDDNTTFHEVGSFLPNANMQWQEMEVDFSNYDGPQGHVAFMAYGSYCYGYIDNIYISEMPTCRKADSLTATVNAATDEITVSWVGPANAQNWDVEYGVTGFVLGTGTVETVSDNSITITNFCHGTDYDVYVRAWCDSDDSSRYRCIKVSTPCAPIERGCMPYFQDFENIPSGTTNPLPTCWTKLSNSTSTGYPYIYSSTTYAHSGSQCIYLYSSSNTVYTAAVLPEFEVGVDSLAINFWVYRNSSTSTYGEVKVGVATNPADYSTFVPVATVQPSSTGMVEYNVNFSNYVDTTNSEHHYIVLSADNSGANGAYVDDIEVYVLSDCRRPVSAYTTNVLYNQLDVVYMADTACSATNYEIRWGLTDNVNAATDSLVTSLTTNTITGLNAETPYYFWIRALCGSDEASRWFALPVVSTTAACGTVEDLDIQYNTANGDIILSWTPSTVGNAVKYYVEYQANNDSVIVDSTTNTFYQVTGTTPLTTYTFRIRTICDQSVSAQLTTNYTTSSCNVIGAGGENVNYVPTHYFYKYNYTQSIYTAGELISLGDSISGLSYYSLGSPNQTRTVSIYMANTDMNAFATTDDYVPADSLTLVYTGPLTVNLGMNSVNFDTVFVRDASRNLVIAVDDNSGAYVSNQGWDNTAVEANRSIYFYQDASDITPSAPTSTSKGVLNRVPKVQFTATCATPSCVAPTVVCNGQTTNSISLNWFAGLFETSWNVDYRQEGDSAWTSVATALAQTNITILNLTPSTPYEVRVVSLCGSNTAETVVNCATDCGIEPLPFAVNFDSWINSDFTPNCWHVGGATAPYVSNVINYGPMLRLYTDSYVMLPDLNAPVNTLQAHFNYVAGDTTAWMLVGVVSDINAIGSMTIIDTLYSTGIGDHTYTIRFDGYNNTVGNIAFYTPHGINYTFIDNLIVEPVRSCAEAINVTASNIDTGSATISWMPYGNTATSYIVEYGPVGFDLGTGMQVATTSTSFTLNGLTPSTNYQAYVYAVCAATGDTSYASMYTRFQTECAPMYAFPYLMDFDYAGQPAATNSYVLPNCWTYEMTATGNYATGTYLPSIYYSTSSSYISSGSRCLRMYGNCVIAIPEVAVPVDTLKLSFHEYNTSPTSYGLIIGVVDSITPGFAASFVAIDTVEYTSGVNNYNHQFYLPYSGNGRHLAFQNYYKSGTTTQYSYHYIDDILLEFVPSCVEPQNLTATATDNSVTLDWADISTASQWEIEYGNHGFAQGSGTTTFATSHPATITGLNYSTEYDFYVRAHCSNGDTSNWSSLSTRTKNIVHNLPVELTFEDSTLYNDIDLLNGTMTNRWTIGSAENCDTANTPGHALYVSSDNGATACYTISSATLIFATINVNLDSGWTYFNYDWKGQGESTYDFMRVALIPGNETLVASSSTSTVTSTTLPAGWIALDGNHHLNQSTVWNHFSDSVQVNTPGTYQFAFIWRNDASIGTSPAGVVDNINIWNSSSRCFTPVIVSETHDYTQSTLTWTGTAESYEVALKATTDAIWPAETAVNSNAYTFTGLQPNTEYQFRVRAICDAEAGLISDWALRTFTTDDLPCFAPTALACGETSLSNATLSWTAGTTETEWNVHVWNSGFDSVYHANSNPFTVTGLTQTTTYNVAVSALCGGGVIESEYSDTITITTQTCPTPGTPTASSVTTNSAVISWTGSAANYMIEYGMGAFGEGQGTTVEVSGTSYTISGLEPESQYTVLVRAKCDNVNLSGWSERAVFTTEPEDIGIDAVNGMNVNIYPNPTSGNTTITLSGVNGEVSIVIVDLNGRTVRNERATCEGDCAHQLEVSDLASGAYFVRISGEGINTVKKLIVK